MKNKTIDTILRLRLFALTGVIAVFCMAFALKQQEQKKNPFLGRWDITVLKSDTGHINRARFCWLEITSEGSTLKGRLQPGEGATVDISDIKIENGVLTFKQGKSAWTASAKGGKLEGTANASSFGPTTRKWVGVRGPDWTAKSGSKKTGTPVNLIGKNASNWLMQYPDRKFGWEVKDGILMNEGTAANNIYTKEKFQDFILDAEFKVDPKSNSGIYLRGRYEIQIMDNYGAPSLNVHSMGCLYGYIIPSTNACKPASEWQKYRITINSNRVTVVLNDITIIDNGEIPGITGGALDSNEKEPGPIMIQGDHGRVQWRKLIVTPLV